MADRKILEKNTAIRISLLSAMDSYGLTYY